MLVLLVNAFFAIRHSSSFVIWSGFMLMSGKLSEKRLRDVAGYHTAMEVGRTSHSLPPFGFPRLRFSQSQRYFCLFSLHSVISLGIQWMNVYPHLSDMLMVVARRAADVHATKHRLSAINAKSTNAADRTTSSFRLSFFSPSMFFVYGV